jgi:uncharacterized membrane protein YqjE
MKAVALTLMAFLILLVVALALFFWHQHRWFEAMGTTALAVHWCNLWRQAWRSVRESRLRQQAAGWCLEGSATPMADPRKDDTGRPLA